ncbi:MAG: hypothetical protein MJY62_02950 [Bacteroidales bacterium]|nr:hypothetical protein [Bacteroidales bacterium]
MQVPSRFVEMLSEAIGKSRAEIALASFDGAPSTCVRTNPSKPAVLPILEGSEPVRWNGFAHILARRPVFTLHPLFHCGAYYVQDSSSMIVGEVFRRLAPECKRGGEPLRILDLCAAPGGKSTDLAASAREMFGNGFVLVANEPVKSRATVLADNVARWGDPSVVVTGCDPQRIGTLGGYFDIVVADVPCSGEGMFRKEPDSLAQWSEDNVNLCAARSRRIVSDMWPCLREGGLLIYSTCTFNKVENDDNVRWICDNLGAEPLDSGEMPEEIIRTGYGLSLVPGFVPGEGQYCAVLRKTSSSPVLKMRPGRNSSRTSPECRTMDAMLPRLLSGSYVCMRRSDMFVALPSHLAQDVEYLYGNLSVLHSGCTLGLLKGRDFVPDEDLALCVDFRPDSYPSVGVTKEMALSYLHKDSFKLDGAPVGIVLLLYKGIPMGFVKNLGGRINNLHPSYRRIRMDIHPQ